MKTWPLKIWPLIPVLGLAVLCQMFALGQTAHGGHPFKRYVNARFRYAICYPSDLLSPQGEPENGDGQSFVGHDGAKLTVYGQNNAMHESLADLLNDTSSRLAGSSGKVTYKVVKPDWFVISGEKDGSVFYAKAFLRQDQIKSFELTYSAAKAATYGPVATRVAGCFANTAAGR